MSRRSGTQYVGFTGFGTAGSENDPLEVWTPAYHSWAAWNYDPAFCGVSGGGATATQIAWAFRIFCPRAFTLTKIGYWIQTGNGTPTAANSTTVAAGSNGVDVTTFVGAQTLNVASIGASPAAGNLLVQTSGGQVLISYTATAAGQYQNCTTKQSGTGTLSTGGTVVQSLNTMGVFNDAGTTCYGILGDQGVNWATAGLNGAAGAAQTLTTPVGTSAAITAGSYLWFVYLATGTTSPNFRSTVNHSQVPNAGIASVANLRVGRVAGGTAQTSFPVTIAPGSLQNSNASGPGYPWVAVL